MQLFDRYFSSFEKENFLSSERQQKRFLFPSFTIAPRGAYGQIAITEFHAIRRRDGDQITRSLGLLSHMTKRGQSLQNSDRSFAATGDSKSYAYSEYYPVLFYRLILQIFYVL